MSYTFVALGAALALFVLAAIACSVYAADDRAGKVDTSSTAAASQIRVKRRLQEQARRNEPSIALHGSQFQRIVKQWVVLDLGGGPAASQHMPAQDGEWCLHVVVNGECVTLTMGDICALETRCYTVDWHCVTGWTYPGLQLQGVDLAQLLHLVHSKCAHAHASRWTWLMQEGSDGYTAPIHKDDLEGAFLALNDGSGEPLSNQHGSVRIVAPTLFGWKSCKWLRRIELLETQRAGFWESLGCHMRGRVRYNERWHEHAAGVWEALVGALDAYYSFLPQAWVLRMMQVSSKALGGMLWLLGVFGKQAPLHTSARRPHAKEKAI